ncbi:MAG: hypothetical protein IJ494_01980 [Bacteroides sp.]|nr:hypothetical protein [Bacteroides sp.]
METLFNDLQNHLAASFGERVSLIDEDYGQLEALANGEDQYPVTFPCILVGLPQVDWRSIKPDIQQGTISLTVRLAFDCYDDTHYGSTQEHHVIGRMAMARELNSYIHGWSFGGSCSPMQRTNTVQSTYPGGIKAYSHTYMAKVEEYTGTSVK